MVTQNDLKVCEGFLKVLLEEVELRSEVEFGRGTKPSFSIILFKDIEAVEVSSGVANIVTISIINKWIKAYFEIHKLPKSVYLMTNIKDCKRVSVICSEEVALLEGLCRLRSNIVNFILNI